MVLAEAKGREVKLIPEFMQVTGITPEVRQDYSIMKELTKAITFTPKETKF